MIRQHYRQYDLASTSRRGQVTLAAPLPARLGGIVASMTQHLHRTVVSHLSSVVASMTQHLHRAATKSSWQRHRQHDSAALLPA
jgi:hypothetical protein